MSYLKSLSEKSLLAVALLALALGMWRAVPASADYPPGVGSVSVSAADTTPSPRSSVQVTATVLDSSGSPQPGVSVSFIITSNPGDASFQGAQSITAVTDENGIARAALYTGAEAGTIVVRAEAAGIVSQVTLATGEPQQLPRTGGAPGSGTAAPLWPAVVGLGATLVIIGMAGIFVVLRPRL